jgi:cation diffusion facilitator family transporter
MNLDAAAASRRHDHAFNEGNPLAERKTLYAALLTALMMVFEIAGGWMFNSMALLADGWHMSSHALALGLATFAYAFARRHSGDARFAFGTWKVEILAGYTSAVLLLCVAALMAVQSVERLVAPLPIDYERAIAIAAVGLAVNLVCAWLLKGDHGHHHEHGHGHGHGHQHDHHHHEDLNLRAAYIHVVADAATSVLAIAALVGAMLWSATWLDPVMGIIGAVLVARWAIGLLRESGRILLDARMDIPVVDEIREAIAADPEPARISDLHVWPVGRGKYACVLGLVTDPDASPDRASPDHYRNAIGIHDELVHITVEVNRA